MFSGIVEEMAILRGIEHEQENIHFTFQCSFTKELKIDQSIAHKWRVPYSRSLPRRYLYGDSHEGNP